MRRKKSIYQSGGLTVEDVLKAAQGRTPVLKPKQKQKGGLTPSQVDSILLANKDKNFVRRYINKGIFPNIPNEDGSVSTHKMESADNFSYPTIIQNQKGKLIDLKRIPYRPSAAYDYAMRTGEFIQFPTEQEAQWFSENGYKTGSLKKGGLTPNKAREILHDKKVHGRKLTPAQFRFFGAMSKGHTKKYEDGGIKTDPMGYWNPDNIGNPIIIPSNEITMEGVNFPVMGISDKGDRKIMMPNKKYKFRGRRVLEIPMMQVGGLNITPIDDKTNVSSNIIAPVSNSIKPVSIVEPRLNPIDESLTAGTINSNTTLKNWYKGRATIPKFKDIATRRYNEVDNIQVKSLDPTTAGDDTAAYYIPGEKNIYIDKKDPYSRGEATQIHEKTHELYNQVPQVNQKNIINNNIVTSQPFILSKEDYDYLKNPTEVAARVNVFRRYFNIDPTKTYSADDIKNILEGYYKNPITNPLEAQQTGLENVQELIQITGGDYNKIANLLNQLVMNNQSSNPTIARKGGSILPKFQTKGEVKPAITLTDKAEFDRRNRSYQDSLSLYNSSINDLNKMYKHFDFIKPGPILSENEVEKVIKNKNPNQDFWEGPAGRLKYGRFKFYKGPGYMGGSYEKQNTLNDYKKDKLKIRPSGWQVELYSSDKYKKGELYDYNAIYKKPEQPYIFQERQPYQRQTLNPKKPKDIGVLEPNIPQQVQAPERFYQDDGTPFMGRPYYRNNQLMGTPRKIKDGRIQMELDGKLIGNPIERGLFNQFGTRDRDNPELEGLMGFQQGGVIAKKQTRQNPYINYKKIFNLVLGELYPKTTSNNRGVIKENTAPSVSQMQNPYRMKQRGGILGMFDQWDEEDNQGKIKQNTAPDVQEVKQGFTQEDLDEARAQGEEEALAMSIAMQEEPSRYNPSQPDTSGPLHVPSSLKNEKFVNNFSLLKGNNLNDIDDRVEMAVQELQSLFPKLKITSGRRNWGDKQAHPVGRAIDLAGEGMDEAWNYYKDNIVPKYGFNPALDPNHGTGKHIHVGFYKQGGVYDVTPEDIIRLKKLGYEFTIK